MPARANLLVASQISRKEWVGIDAAKAAVQAEWDRLRAKQTWIEPKSADEVIFFDAVMKKARMSGKKVHLGRLFDICVLKGSELEPGHVNRKWKGRVVFGGNNVQDECGLAAFSQRLAVELRMDLHPNFLM